MERYTYRPFRFYITVFAVTWFFWLLAILCKESSLLFLFMLLGLMTPAIVAVVTVLTSKSNALKQDFKRKIIGFYRIKPRYIILAVCLFAIAVVASIGTSILFGGSVKQFSFTEDFPFPSEEHLLYLRFYWPPA